jgi:hypothetical protein
LVSRNCEYVRGRGLGEEVEGDSEESFIQIEYLDRCSFIVHLSFSPSLTYSKTSKNPGWACIALVVPLVPLGPWAGWWAKS